ATQIVLVLDHLLQSSSASRVTAGARTPAQMVTPARRHRRGSVCLAFASDRGVSRPLTQVLARGRHRRQARPTFFASESIPCNSAYLLVVPGISRSRIIDNSLVNFGGISPREHYQGSRIRYPAAFEPSARVSQFWSNIYQQECVSLPAHAIRWFAGL